MLHNTRGTAFYLVNKVKGFTLIELLVVITILGVLAAAVLVAINPGKRMGQARDARRKADLAQIQSILQEYYIINGRYPEPVAGGAGCWGTWEAGSTINGANDQFLQVLVDGGYLKKSPIETSPLPDPSWSGTLGWGRCSYRYIRVYNPCGGSTKTFAVLYTWLETDSGADDYRPPHFTSACWGEADPSNPTIDNQDWAYFMEE